MARSSGTTIVLLAPLLRRLVLDTSRCMYAETGALRALSAPRARGDGRWDVIIDIQPKHDAAARRLRPGAEFIACPEPPAPPSALTARRAGMISGHRLIVEGLASGRYRLTPATLSHALRAATSHWRRIQRASEARAAASPVDGDQEVWSWRSEDARLNGHAVLQRDGDLVFRFWSGDLSLEGVRLFVLAGVHRLPLVLARYGEQELMGEVTLPRAVRQIAESPASFEVEEG